MVTDKRRTMITGGTGSAVSHMGRLFVNKYSDYNIINLDKQERMNNSTVGN